MNAAPFLKNLVFLCRVDLFSFVSSVSCSFLLKWRKAIQAEVL